MAFSNCNSSVDHIQMKEQARQQRAKEASEWQKKTPAAAPAPLFDPPIQRRYSDDPIHQQCNNVLGNFDEARPFVYSASSVGASFQPMTPCGQGTPSSDADPWSRLPDKSSTSSTRPNGLGGSSKRPGEVMQGIFDKFDVSESVVKNKCVLSVGQVKPERVSPTVGLGAGVEATRHIRPVEGAVKPVAVKPAIAKKEPPELGVKPAVSKKERTGKEPSKGAWSSKGVDKSSHHSNVSVDAKNGMSVLSGDAAKLKTSNDVGSVKPSDDRHGHEHSESRVAPPAVSVTPKRFQSPKRLPQSSVSSQGLTPKKPCAKLHNGVVVNGVSKLDSDDTGTNDSSANANTKLKSLKLKITNPSKVQASEEDPVEEVFREMRLHPPLTAIDTPRKEEKFPFTTPTTDPVVKTPTVEASSKTLTKRKSHDGTATAKVRRVSSVGNLEKDLVLSSDSDSDDEQEPATDAPSGKVVAGKVIPDRAVQRSTSNKMSSETSESESSDDDDASSSSNSEEEVEREEEKEEEGERRKVVKEEPTIPVPGVAASMQSKWNLENFIPKEKVGGLMATAAETEAASTPVNLSEPDAQHLDELCHNIINNSDFLQKSPLSPLDTIIQRSECSVEGASVSQSKKSPSSVLSGNSTSTPKRNGELTPKGGSETKRGSSVKCDLFNTPRRTAKAKKDTDKKRSGKTKRDLSVSPAPEKSHSTTAAKRRTADKKPSSGTKPRQSGKRAAGKSPRSKEFVSSSSDSSENDETSFVDVVGISSPEKDRTAAVSRSQPSGKVAPKVEPKSSPKSDISLDLKDVFAQPLLSPIPAESKHTDTPAAAHNSASVSVCGINYVDGKPSIMVRLKRSIFQVTPPNDSHRSNAAGDSVVKSDMTSKVTSEMMSDVKSEVTSDVTSDVVMSDVTSPPNTVDSSHTLQSNPKFSDARQNDNDTMKPVPVKQEKTDSVPVPVPVPKDGGDLVNDTPAANGCVEWTDVASDAASADTKCVKVAGAGEKKKRPMPVDILAQFSNGDAPRPLPKMKIPKRKPEASSDTDSQQDCSKRSRVTDVTASPRRVVSDDVTDQESTSHKDDHAWDRKHPRRSDRPPGGSTSSSISSQHSQAATDTVDSRYGSRSTERDRSTHRDGRDWDRDHHKLRTDWDAPSDVSESQCDSPARYRASNSHGNQYQKVGSDWGAMAAGQSDTYPDRHTRGNYSPYSNGSSHYRPTHHTRNVGTQMSPKHKCCHRVDPVEDKLRSAAYYLDIAKKVKHQADSTSDPVTKFLTYIDAGIYFIQWCFAMEREHTSDSNRIFCMYSDTLKLIKHKYSSRSSHEPGEIHDKEAKLTVLSLRMQSILCLKLFQLKRNELNRLKKVIDEYKSGASKPSHVQVPSPYQANSATWSRTSGTPSPMSPQQSPAGSVGSVSSVGSGSGDHGVSKMMNGNHNPCGSGGTGGTGGMAPATVSVPQRIHSVTQQYLGIMNYLSQGHDIWDQADLKAREYKDFFTSLDTDCGQLTMQSKVTEFARYIKVAVQRIKAT